MRKTLKNVFCYFLFFIIITENILFNFNIYKVSAETEPVGNAVDAVDSFRITHVYDPNLIYIEWKNGNPAIEGTGELVSGEQVRFFMDWSVKEGVSVNPGDYFTFTFPDVFEHKWIETKNNIEITHPDDGTVMAKYSIRENNGKKELIITFTEGIIGHENIAGKYELVMFAGNFETKTETSMSFEINGNMITINNGITGNPAPPPPYIERGDAKWGSRAALEQVIDGHYYFKWTIWINFKFDTIDNFSVNDIIPANSPHVLITPQTIEELGINIPNNLNHLYHMTIREYTGSDDLSQQDRYKQFQAHLNNIGGWYEDYMSQYTIDTASMTSAPEPLDGIDSGKGINLNNFTFFSDGKGFSANLQRVTRPVIIDYYTITSQPFSTNAFYDDATASTIKNTVVLNGEATKSSHIYTIWIDESASIGGIYGNYNFTFRKVNEDNRRLAGAIFALYTSPDCEGLADRNAESQADGTVAFGNLKAGTYYIKEIIPPEGYILTDTIYKVELTNNACVISAPDGSAVTEIINYTNTPEEEIETETEEDTEKETETEEDTEKETETEEDTEKETETEEPTNKPYIPDPIELITTTEPTATVSEDENTTATETKTTALSATEPTVAESEIIEEPSEIIFPSDEEIINVPGLPDGYSIEQIGDNLFEIYDDDGIPLGSITVPEGELIEDLEYEDIIDNLIPLENVDLPEETEMIFQAPELDIQQETNPQTNDLIWINILVFISFSSILISLLLIYKKEYN